VEALVGPKGRHDPGRMAVRHGSDDRLVTLGERQVAIRRPRAWSADGKAKVPATTYGCVTSTEVLEQMAMEKMLAKISTRRYGAGFEPVGAARLAAGWLTPLPPARLTEVAALAAHRLGNLSNSPAGLPGGGNRQH